MKDFYEKIEYEFKDIEMLISNSVEESPYLDFKSSESLGKTDRKKNEISKDVSSFANSQGGIIIYGIKEENHVASELSFINGNTLTKEWLEHVLSSSIQRRIDNLKIIPIHKDNNFEKTIYIVKIPKSLDAPHISRNKRFYKRYNFESAPMEEYEIRGLYGRSLKSELSISNWSLNTIEIKEDIILVLAEASIYNVGELCENSFKTNVIFKNAPKGMTYSWSKESGINYTRLTGDRIKISNTSSNLIYPNEEVNGIRFNIEIQRNIDLQELNEVIVEIYLFYENGEDKMETSLLNISENLNNLIYKEKENNDNV